MGFNSGFKALVQHLV